MREPGGQGLEFVVRSHQAHQLLQSPIGCASHHWPELPRARLPQAHGTFPAAAGPGMALPAQLGW